MDTEKKKLIAQTLDNENVMQDILDTIICSVCEEPLYSPIYMCQKAHNLCSDCRSKILYPSCPLCQSAISNQRNFSLEVIMLKLEEFRFLCPNAVNGCTARVPIDNMDNHESKCSFKPNIMCAMQEMGKCTHKVTFTNYLEHFEKQHPRNILRNIDNLFLNKINVFEGCNNIALIKQEHNLFIYHMNINLKNNSAFWIVKYVGLKEEAGKWCFRINTSDENQTYSINASAKCCSLFRKSQEIYSSGHCVGIPVNILKNFFQKQTSLPFKLQIYPTTPNK